MSTRTLLTTVITTLVALVASVVGAADYKGPIKLLPTKDGSTLYSLNMDAKEIAVVNVEDGEIVKLTKEGIVTRDSFQIQIDYLPRRCWYPSMMRHFDCEDDAFADLLDICGCYGVTEEEIMYLRECGFTFDEIEEYLFDPSCIWDDEEVGVEL